MNPNNPHIKEPRKSKRRARLSHGLLESSTVFRARGAPGAKGSIVPRLGHACPRLAQGCTRGTPAAHASAWARLPRCVLALQKPGHACLAPFKFHRGVGLRCRASAASSQPCERQSRVGGWVSIETNGLSSRLGANGHHVQDSQQAKGKENPKRYHLKEPRKSKRRALLSHGLLKSSTASRDAVHLLRGSIVPLFSVSKQPRKELSQLSSRPNPPFTRAALKPCARLSTRTVRQAFRLVS